MSEDRPISSLIREGLWLATGALVVTMLVRWAESKSDDESEDDEESEA
jgi:hypothetical protein